MIPIDRETQDQIIDLINYLVGCFGEEVEDAIKIAALRFATPESAVLDIWYNDDVRVNQFG